MSAVGVTDALVEAIGSGAYDFIVANFANPDMVGHTGVWDATIAGLEVIDALPRAHRRRRSEAVDADDPAAPGALLAITADHGNADELRDAEGRPVTAHSLNPVPFVLVGRAARGLALGDGVLADVAPTLLDAGRPAALARDDRLARASCDSIRRRSVQRSLDSWIPFWPSARSW